MSYVRSTKTSTMGLRVSKSRVSRVTRQPCFTMKRSLLFQVRKSLVEYVDEELLRMSTSVFYQRIFILAKNVEPPRQSAEAKPVVTLGATVSKEIDGSDGDDEDRAADKSEETTVSGVKEVDVHESDREMVTQTFRFDNDSNLEESDGEDEEEEEEEVQPVTAAPAPPKDMFVLFTEKLQSLARRCMKLAYTPDPMCGLLVYMNDYTMLMLESGEDMMGIFCEQLLGCCAEFWQSNRVFMIEDHIDKVSVGERWSQLIGLLSFSLFLSRLSSLAVHQRAGLPAHFCCLVK